MPAGVQADPFEAIFSSRNASNQGPGDGVQQAGPSCSGSSAWSSPSSPRGPDNLGSNLSGGNLSSGNPFARGHAAPSSTGDARTASPARKHTYNAFQVCWHGIQCSRSAVHTSGPWIAMLRSPSDKVAEATCHGSWVGSSSDDALGLELQNAACRGVGKDALCNGQPSASAQHSCRLNFPS